MDIHIKKQLGKTNWIACKIIVVRKFGIRERYLKEHILKSNGG